MSFRNAHRCFLAAALLAVVAPSQGDSRPAPSSAPAASDPQTLIGRLESVSFDVRNRALEELRGLAESARPALEAHRDSKLLETRTRVRELLDELDQARGRLRPSESRPGRLAPFDGGHDVDPFGEDPTTGDPRMRRSRGGSPPGGLEPFEELRRMQAEMDRLMRDGRAFPPTGGLFGGRPTFQFDFGPGTGGTSSRTLIRDGAVLTLSESPDGATFETVVDGAKETYKAKDLQTLKSEHPELVERFGDSGIFDSGAGGVFVGDPFGGTRNRPQRPVESRPSGGRSLRPIPSAPPVPTPNLRLGVAVSAVPSLLDRHLRLGGVGVVIESVEPDSAAKTAGLLIDDVVTHCGGEPVGSAEDLRRILSKGGTSVVVRIVREGTPQEISVGFPNRR